MWNQLLLNDKIRYKNKFIRFLYIITHFSLDKRNHAFFLFCVVCVYIIITCVDGKEGGHTHTHKVSVETTKK